VSSTLDFAQHPNYAKALAVHFRKVASSGTEVLLHGRVGDPRNHLPASEIIGSPVVYQSVVDPAFNRAVQTSEAANADAFIAADVRPLSLISLQTISQLSKEIGQTLDPRRFRLNLHLDLPDDPFTEEISWGVRSLSDRARRYRFETGVPRRRFITYVPEFSDAIDPLFPLMKFLDRHHQGRVGFYASIVVSGPIPAGDPIIRGRIASLMSMNGRASEYGNSKEAPNKMRLFSIGLPGKRPLLFSGAGRGWEQE
jgi:hypothetical protein